MISVKMVFFVREIFLFLFILKNHLMIKNDKNSESDEKK